MDVVIDAQILAWYYQASELGRPHPCSGDPVALFARLGRQDHAVLDAGQHIESEWRRVADSEWFDAWLFTRLVAGDISVVEVETCGALLRVLEIRCGFPRSGDRWYVRTAATRARSSGAEVGQITEDIDLYEPSAKRDSRRRRRALERCRGSVVTELARVDVAVRTVAHHLT